MKRRRRGGGRRRRRRRRKEEEEEEKERKTNNKMVLHIFLSILTLNVNGLNGPTKRHKVAEWIRKQTHIYAASKRPISDQKRHTD